MSMRLPAVAAGLILCLAVARPARTEELARGAFVGVSASSVGDDLRKKLKLPAGAGVLVGKLIPGGSAEAAGLRAGDVLLRIGDRTVGSPEEFVQTVKALRAGQAVSVRFVRDGKEAALEVRLRPRPFEKASDVDTIYGAVRVDGSLRRTLVTRPRAPGRYPALLYVTGIGCFSQESLDLGSADAKLLYGLTRASGEPPQLSLPELSSAAIDPGVSQARSGGRWRSRAGCHRDRERGNRSRPRAAP